MNPPRASLPIDQALTWVQPRALKAEYQLIADGKALASLRWKKALGSLARAEAADGRWAFKRVGFLRPRVTVRAEGSVADAAMSEPGTGFLLFSDEAGKASQALSSGSPGGTARASVPIGF